MDNAGFSAVRWDHWLLVVCFLAVASYGIYLSWQWKRDAKVRRAKRMLARRLQMNQQNTQAVGKARSQQPDLQQRLQQTYSRKR